MMYYLLEVTWIFIEFIRIDFPHKAALVKRLFKRVVADSGATAIPLTSPSVYQFGSWTGPFPYVYQNEARDKYLAAAHFPW